VIELHNKGFKGDEVGQALGISERTVRRYLKVVAA
jgi:response regulator of citrate/malate metabolism